MLRLCINVFRRSVAGAGREMCRLQPVASFTAIARAGVPTIAHTCSLPSTVSSHSAPLLLRSVLNNPKVQNIPCRTVTKFTLSKGKRRTVKAVIKRFYRLHWGMWIRTKAGRFRKAWKKSPNRRRRLRQHVFTNSTQSWLLDKMVTAYWRRPKYWVDNPYEPYNTREEYFATSRKPRDYWQDQ